MSNRPEIVFSEHQLNDMIMFIATGVNEMYTYSDTIALDELTTVITSRVNRFIDRTNRVKE